MNAYDQVEDWLADMIGAPPSKQVEISDKISLLCAAYMAPTLETNVELTPSEDLIFSLLRQKLDRTVSMDAIRSVLAVNKPDGPADKTIQVLVCRLRKWLVGKEYRLDNIWGRGYRLVLSSAPIPTAAHIEGEATSNYRQRRVENGQADKIAA